MDIESILIVKIILVVIFVLIIYAATGALVWLHTNLRQPWKALVAVSLFPTFLVCCFVAIGHFVVPDCGGTSEAVAMAKSLSQDELALLYGDMSSLVNTDRDRPEIIFESSAGYESLPQSIRKLESKGVAVGGGWSRIVLAGCFESKVTMTFKGIPFRNSGSQEPGIVLQWGDGPDFGSEVLWRP